MCRLLKWMDRGLIIDDKNTFGGAQNFQTFLCHVFGEFQRWKREILLRIDWQSHNCTTGGSGEATTCHCQRRNDTDVDVSGRRPSEAGWKIWNYIKWGRTLSCCGSQRFPSIDRFWENIPWDHDGNLKIRIRMEDPDYMKKRLLEWVHVVGAYARLLQGHINSSVKQSSKL